MMATEPAKAKERDVANVALFREMVNMARVIATQEGVTMADVFERHARAGLVRRYKSVLAELNREFDLGGEGG